MKWARKYGQCISCGTVEKQHMAKGLCVYCYAKQYNSDPKNIEKIKLRKYAHYLRKQKPIAKEKRNLRFFDGKWDLVLARDKKCCICGREEGLVVHHIDCNGRNVKTPNNDLANLQTLCRGCHCKVHTDLLHKANREKLSLKWAKNYERCIDCGTTERKHNARGLCHLCYNRRKNKRNSLNSKET